MNDGDSNVIMDTGDPNLTPSRPAIQITQATRLNVQDRGPKFKRPLKETSPDDLNQADSQEQVGNMNVSDLMLLMTSSLAGLLDDKLKNLPTKGDIEGIKTEMGVLSSKVAELTEENHALKEKILKLEAQREQDMKDIKHVVNTQKRKSLVIKGLEKNRIPSEEVKKLCSETLQIQNIQIASTKVLFEHNGKIGVAVEFQTEDNVRYILNNIKKLQNSSVSIERDLNSERQADKKALLKLKKNLLSIDQTHRIVVRDDRMKIGDNWLKWNSEKQLICGDKNGFEVLVALYGNKISSSNLNYYDIFKNNTKN